MIGWLEGVVLEKQAPDLLLNVNGVGYELQAPLSSFYAWENKEKISLYTHLAVREDAQQLYGFATRDERSLFRTLIRVNGIGPKLALTILSSMEADRFVLCIQTEDSAALCKIPGIGKKTAERLLIEMRDRLKDWMVSSDGEIAETGKQKTVLSQNHVVQEAESALIALGYKPQEAAKMLQQVASAELQTAEALIRAALKRMI